MSIRYFDRQGRPISPLKWAILHEDIGYKRIAETTLPSGHRVSTVWLGFDLQCSDAPPLIFETMVFERGADRADLDTIRYSTEEEALEGHNRMVASWSSGELMGKTYSATGSLEGTLEMVTIHEQRYFRVYDAIYGWGVPCYFGPELLDVVKSSFGRRISVVGQVRTDRMGKPLSIRVSDMRMFPREEELPKPSEMRGLVRGMTEGQRAEDYLRELRNDEL